LIVAEKAETLREGVATAAAALDAGRAAEVLARLIKASHGGAKGI
jgi:anthranilate phosphoribosyltransferase